MHRAPDRVLIPAANGGGDDDVRAKRDADEEIDDEADDGAVRAHGRDRQRARLSCEVADDGQIRGVEELLEDRRCRHRQGKERKLVPDRTVQHVDLVFFAVCHKKNTLL